MPARRTPVQYRTPAQREEHMAIEADLYCKGYTQEAIARQLGISRPQVGFDLKKIFQRWKESQIRDFDQARTRELMKIDRMEREAWDAWERSKQDRTETLSERKEGPRGGTKHRVSRKQYVGDAVFLTLVSKCIEMRVNLLGLSAPQEHRVSGGIAVAHTLNQPKSDAVVAAEQAALRVLEGKYAAVGDGERNGGHAGGGSDLVRSLPVPGEVLRGQLSEETGPEGSPGWDE